MQIRGLVGIGAVALLAGCGGAAAATPSAPEATSEVDVKAVARDEIAALEDLGYPTELATWVFADEHENSAGGTATTWGDWRGLSTVLISTDADAYLTFSPDIEAAVRSTVRHEFGHVLTNRLYPNGSEEPLAPSCVDSNEATRETGSPAGECAAESISAALATERGDERVPFYGLVLSDDSLGYAPPVLRGAPTWTIPEP